MLLVVIVIALIPAIYAGLFLASMWDPYGNVDKLPVAIVNEDEPAEYGDTTLTVGDQLVDNLKENDSLAFNFVDADVAKEGLKNGTYYMAITIPKNFSANAATVMDDQPEKMILNYETNPGTNYIASKLSETALGKIKTPKPIRKLFLIRSEPPETVCRKQPTGQKRSKTVWTMHLMVIRKSQIT